MIKFLLFLLLTGLLSWNLTDCHVNLEEELSTITALALDGEEGKNGKDYRKSMLCMHVNATFPETNFQIIS